MHARALAGMAAIAWLAWPTTALAGLQIVDDDVSNADAGTSNVDAMLRALTRDVANLSVADCTLSCRALASMERARDRICELSPGARCDDARAKVASARDKVAAACPSCATHERPEPAPPNDAKASAPPEPAPANQSVASEHRTGGCAGCRTASTGDKLGDAGLVILATLALRGLSRRRADRKRDRDK
jgi:hypothetical protein